MYQDYFSLDRHPFRITPDTSLFFSGGDEGRGVVLEAMLFAIESGEGIIKVVGEVGSGKTMLCRMLEERLPESTELVYLANPNLAPEEVLYAVALELKLPVRSNTSKLLVMQQLQSYLLKQHAANRKVLVVIEEAQGMPLETLEEIRLFSNLETHRDKLLQIILFGQPELDRNLKTRHIRQLNERITHSFHLKPLTGKETADYIRHRLGAAGCPCPQLFTHPAEWLIAKASGGLTRRINILADKALLAAFSEDVLALPERLGPDVPPVIRAKHVLAAIKDSEFSFSVYDTYLTPIRWVGVGSLVLLTALALIWSVPRALQAEGLPAAADLLDLDAALTVDTPAQGSPNAGPVPATGQGKEIDKAPAQPLAPIAKLAVPVASPAANAGEHWQGAATASLDWQPADTAPPSWSGQFPLSLNRAAATLEWLRSAEQDGYTLQFMSGPLDNLDFAENFLRTLQDKELLRQSFLCISDEGSGPYWTLKHGNFEGLSVANHYLEQMPAALKEYGPFVQNISGILCNYNQTLGSANAISAVTGE